jgi:hypothetical protein
LRSQRRRSPRCRSRVPACVVRLGLGLGRRRRVLACVRLGRRRRAVLRARTTVPRESTCPQLGRLPLLLPTGAPCGVRGLRRSSAASRRGGEPPVMTAAVVTDGRLLTATATAATTAASVEATDGASPSTGAGLAASPGTDRGPDHGPRRGTTGSRRHRRRRCRRCRRLLRCWCLTAPRRARIASGSLPRSAT